MTITFAINNCAEIAKIGNPSRCLCDNVCGHAFLLIPCDGDHSGHAIALAHSGDSIMVAAATDSENLTISKSLKIIGSSASTTIIDGGGVSRVVTLPNTSTSVILSRMTIRNGVAEAGELTTLES